MFLTYVAAGLAVAAEPAAVEGSGFAGTAFGDIADVGGVGLPAAGNCLPSASPLAGLLEAAFLAGLAEALSIAAANPCEGAAAAAESPLSVLSWLTCACTCGGGVCMFG
jgi:hypothetical protein